MHDVNPLGPMMHLKEIERDASALRAAPTKGRPNILGAASGWIMRLLKRLSISRRALNAGDSANIGRP
jgi:hypothetical protein